MKNYKSGFTSIELFIAITISSVIMLTIYSTFNLGINTFRRVEGLISMYQKALNFFDIIEKDLKNILIYSDDFSGFTGSQEEITFFTIADIIAKEDALRQETQMVKASYFIKDGKFFRQLQKQNEDLEFEIISQQPLISVKEIKFYYPYSNNELQSDCIWKSAWDQKYIPQGITLNLSLEDKKSKQGLNLNKTIFIAQGELGLQDF